MRTNRRKLSVNALSFLLAPLVMAHAFAMDIYVPALSHLTIEFQTTDRLMILTLTSFMITAGFMQLIIGPLSDHFGRKKTAVVVTGLFAVGSLLCALSTGVYWLIFARIIQSSGSAGMMVIGFAIVRDCYQGREGAKVFASLNGLIAFSPMFAPFIGSYLDIHYGWPSIFASLIVLALWALLHLTSAIPETLALGQRTKFKKTLYKDYYAISQNKVFALYTLATAFGLSYLYFFCAMSPYIIIKQLKIAESDYGFYFAYMGFSFFIGSLLCRLVVGHLGIYKTCLLGFALSLLGGLSMSLYQYCFALTLNGFIYPMLLIGIGGTFCMGAGNGGAMSPFDRNIGAASALSGAFRFIFPAMIGYFIFPNPITNAYPLGLSAIVFSILGLLLFLAQKSRLRVHEASSND
jgi:DHA1 family bicyclomycin/chloramphenicol resistance-like MFS transporter